MEERKKEKSCGIIVFDDKNRVLMVKHKEGHYGFPKGHVEPNETENETKNNPKWKRFWGII